MKESPKGLIDFNEVLFASPASHEKYFPRIPNSSSLNKNIKNDDFYKSQFDALPGKMPHQNDGYNPRNRKISGSFTKKYYGSPYLSDPFSPRPPDILKHERTQRHADFSSRPSKPGSRARIERAMNILTSARRERAQSPRRVAQPIVYSDRCRYFDNKRSQFFNGLTTRYALENAGLPYRADLVSMREEALKRSAHERYVSMVEDRRETRQMNRERSDAVAYELENDHHFHLDHVINSHYKELRMIPVTDRVTRSKDEKYLFI